MHCMQVEFGHKTVKFEITGLASGMNKIANKVRFMIFFIESKAPSLISHFIYIYTLFLAEYTCLCAKYNFVLFLPFIMVFRPLLISTKKQMDGILTT